MKPVPDVANDEEGYDYGKDVFNKEEVVKEHTLHSHIPVDAILNMDVDDMHMGNLLPKKR